MSRRRSCASAPRPGQDGTWLIPDMVDAYCKLHELGFAHSIEAWEGDTLVGGLYGISLGAAFFGESMFSRASDASKVASVHLVASLRLGGFQLLGTQFLTTHQPRFGAREIPRDEYKARLAIAIEAPAAWLPSPAPAALAQEFMAIAGKQPFGEDPL